MLPLPVLALRVTTAVLELNERVMAQEPDAMAELEVLAGILAARKEQGPSDSTR